MFQSDHYDTTPLATNQSEAKRRVSIITAMISPKHLPQIAPCHNYQTTHKTQGGRKSIAGITREGHLFGPPML